MERNELELNILERFDTRNSIQECALNRGIALLSIAFVLIGGNKYASLSGLIYMLTGVVMGVNGTIMGRQRRRLETSLNKRALDAA